MKPWKRYALTGLALLTAASLDLWRYHARHEMLSPQPAARPTAGAGGVVSPHAA